VPRNYLDFEQEGVARAKFEFDSKTPVELRLRKVSLYTQMVDVIEHLLRSNELCTKHFTLFDYRVCARIARNAVDTKQ